MGVMTFLLPDALSAEIRRELERAAINGGPGQHATPTDVTLDARSGQLRLRRSADESGYLVVPWRSLGSVA